MSFSVNKTIEKSKDNQTDKTICKRNFISLQTTENKWIEINLIAFVIS